MVWCGVVIDARYNACSSQNLPFYSAKILCFAKTRPHAVQHYIFFVDVYCDFRGYDF
jgi:hypothetical protein